MTGNDQSQVREEKEKSSMRGGKKQSNDGHYGEGKRTADSYVRKMKQGQGRMGGGDQREQRVEAVTKRQVSTRVYVCVCVCVFVHFMSIRRQLFLCAGAERIKDKIDRTLTR